MGNAEYMGSSVPHLLWQTWQQLKMKLLGCLLLLSSSCLSSPIFSLLAGPAALPADAAAAAAAAAAGGGAVALPPIIEVGAVGCALGCSPLAKLLPLKIKGLLGLGIGLGLKSLLGNQSEGKKPKPSYGRQHGQHRQYGQARKRTKSQRWRNYGRRNHH